MGCDTSVTVAENIVFGAKTWASSPIILMDTYEKARWFTRYFCKHALSTSCR